MSRKRRATVARGAAGFTLLEAIVTLVIVAMLVTVLMQALAQAMNVRTRLLRFEGESRVTALQEAWFRDTTLGMQRDQVAPDEDALGARNWLQYATPSPLAAQGYSTVRWWLKDNQLHYSDSQVSDIVVIEGPLQNAEFSYLNEQGQWVSDWPWKEHEKLPRLVRFTATTQRASLDWLVAVMADGQNPKDLVMDDVGKNDI